MKLFGKELKFNGFDIWHKGNLDITTKANLSSPSLTGTPTAPTAAIATNTTQIATTAFVQAIINSGGTNSIVIKTQEFTATAGQTLFTLTNGSFGVGTNRLNVFIHGVIQPITAYTESSATTINFIVGLENGDKVLCKWIEIVDTSLLGTSHVTTHLTGGGDAIPLATTTTDGLMSGIDKVAISNKLNSSVYTASDILAKIKTVDGIGSGLDADTVDGKQASDFAPAGFGLGVPLSGIQISDSNNATTTGMYYVLPNDPHKPSGVNDGSIFVMAYSTIYLCQLFMDWRTNIHYTRTCNNGTWSSWVRLWSDNNTGIKIANKYSVEYNATEDSLDFIYVG